MRILQINKFFYVRDGTSRYFFNISRLLREKGHEVLYFSMLDKRNIESDYSKYFVSNISYDERKYFNILTKVPRIFYSFEAQKKIKNLLDDHHVDVAHIHNIYHHISSSVLWELKKRKIPIIMTAHDYHLVAPNYLLFHDGKVCEITKPDNYYAALFHKCVGDSFTTSFIEVAEKYFSKLAREKNLIDVVILPSQFVKSKFIQYGYPAEKLVVLPFFIYPEKNKVLKSGKYVLYVGGLYKQKGVDFLIQVMKTLPKIPCLIVGDGPQKNHLHRLIVDLKVSNVKLLGYQSQSQLKKLFSSAKFTVMPSLWYEGFGLVNLEANSHGKPVLAAKIGGIVEVVEDGVNGLLFKPGDRKDFREKIVMLWNDNNLCLKLGKRALLKVARDYNPDDHLAKILEIYQSVCS